MTTLSPKETVLAIWERIFNRHDLQAADELVAENYQQNTEGLPGGRDGFKAVFSQYLAMSPNLHVAPFSVIEIDDIAIIRGEVFMDNPPEGYTSPIEIVDVFRVINGQVTEHWELSGKR